MSRVILLLAVCWLAIPWTSAVAADPPKAPPMAEGEATISELNYFSNFNTSAYSLSIGTLQIRADRQGPPCEGTATGQRIAVRYDNMMVVLGSGQTACKLKVRRMEFTGAPEAR